MKKIIVNILIGSLLTYSFSTLLTGCTDRNETDCNGVFRDLSEEIKAYAPYTVGNYWVYQLKSDTTILDTLTCTFRTDFENDLDDDNSFGGANPCTKLYRGVLEHSNISKFSLPGDISKPGREEIKVYSTKWEALHIGRNIYPNGVAADFFWYPNEPQTTLDPIYGYRIINNDTSLKIKQTDFSDVTLSVYLSEDGKLNFPNILDSIYMFSGIGIIQYKDDDDTWQLIDFNIQ